MHDKGKNQSTGDREAFAAGMKHGSRAFMFTLLEMKREADKGIHRAPDVPALLLERAAKIRLADYPSEKYAEGVRAGVDYMFATAAWHGYQAMGLDQERH